MPNFAKIGQSAPVISRVLWFFTMAAAAILVFYILHFNSLSPVGCQFASSCQISSTSDKRLLRYGDLTFFSKWRPSAILDLSDAYWDHPRRLLCGLYRFAKVGWNRCSTFDNMKVLIFCAFGLKTPTHAPKLGFWVDFTPVVKSNIMWLPKCTNFAKSRRLSH